MARHLQTRRLVAGDTLNLDSDKSFYIVVDGSVQVFAQTGKPGKAPDAYDDEDDNGYQLLNNVESGGTLSSLFTILSLFTEDVKLRYEEETDGARSVPSDNYTRSRTTSHGSPPSRSESKKRPPMDRDPDVSEFNLNEHNYAQRTGRTTNPLPPSASSVSLDPSRSRLFGNTGRPGSTSSFASSSTLMRDSRDDSDSATEAGSPPPPPSAQMRHLDPIASLPTTPGYSASSAGLHSSNPFDSAASSTSRMKEGAGREQVREGTIARATVDTTLAVIPAEAFRRLTKKFPNAAAHIVQGPFLILVVVDCADTLMQ